MHMSRAQCLHIEISSSGTLRVTAIHRVRTAARQVARTSASHTVALKQVLVMNKHVTERRLTTGNERRSPDREMRQRTSYFFSNRSLPLHFSSKKHVF
jgi:hypothetical protein